MATTTNPSDPRLQEKLPDGQNKAHIVLSEEERAKGFVRPVRMKYQHVGEKPKYPLRDLTDEENERYRNYGYAQFEEYPGKDGAGRYWTQRQLEHKCGVITNMPQEIAETYARNPKYYGSTFCCGCHNYFPVAEFVWDGTDEVVGS